MKISARNQIPGTIVAIVPGAVNGSIKVDIGGGTIITSNITEEAIADLALAVGDRVFVVVKASDVLIGSKATRHPQRKLGSYAIEAHPTLLRSQPSLR